MVSLEGGEELEAAIAAGEFFGLFAGVVAVFLGEFDAVVYLVDLLCSVCWVGHC